MFRVIVTFKNVPAGWDFVEVWWAMRARVSARRSMRRRWVMRGGERIGVQVMDVSGAVYVGGGFETGGGIGGGAVAGDAR